MANHRKRPLIFAVAGLVVVWLLAWGGYRYFAASKATAEKVAAYLHSVDLARLSGKERAKALRELAEQINKLSPEDRRRARLEQDWQRWFDAMTEAEKSEFIEATLPSGFKQMLASFEQLPEENRRRAVEDALRGLDRARREMARDDPASAADPEKRRREELSPELREKVIKIGLNSFYSESSAQTKAELAPVLEEMQRLMELGVPLRRRR